MIGLILGSLEESYNPGTDTRGLIAPEDGINTLHSCDAGPCVANFE